MGCFLSERTLTLHDLANNGLLQLDQIRVYNPLSIYPNQTSTNDNDIEKETEEDFLEEIDPSSRRSSNKSNEPVVLGKRQTDPALPSKQTKLNKSLSNDNQRKSSSNNEKKTSNDREQRRQITTASTTSSRSSKPTTATTKKTSKCKKIPCG